MKTNTNVKFYTLSDFPSQQKVGSFLHLNAASGQHPVGLYFCDSNGWNCLTNTDGAVSAKLIGTKLYFYGPNAASDDDYLFYADLGNTWNCGDYDNNILRHVQNLKTNSLEYHPIRKVDVPDGVAVVSVSTIPTGISSDDTSDNPPEYIQLTSNHHYYCLCGKKPLATSLEYGEISVSYASGYERIYIKNSSNEIVEFEPTDHKKNVVVNATFKNVDLEPVDSVCTWEINYSDITSAGISTGGAAVFVRDNSTGKQTVPDVVFDDENSILKIYLYSTVNIEDSAYTAIVMGSNYNRN